MIAYLELKDVDKLTWRLIASSDTFTEILTNPLIYKKFREALYNLSVDESITWIEENRFLMLNKTSLIFDAKTNDIFDLFEEVIPREVNIKYKRDQYLSEILT